MSAPFELIVAPYTVYLAPVGTAFPLVNAAPAGTWFKLGTSGPKSYDAKGVTVSHPQTIQKFTPAGGTAARKAWRSDEQFLIDFELADLTPEQYAKVLNDATVNTTVGPPNTKDFNLLQGPTVSTFALIARGVSSVNDTLPSQYQVPIVIQAASPAPIGSKAAPSLLACQFEALEDAVLGFGKRVDQIS